MNAHVPVPAFPTAGPDLVGLTASIATAYVARNHVTPAELPRLLDAVHGGLRALADAPSPALVERVTLEQARASIRPDALISFEDGRPYKALRRHLTLRGLTPEAYRRKWGLPVDYPMVTAQYSARRSEISRVIAAAQGRTEGAAA